MCLTAFNWLFNQLGPQAGILAVGRFPGRDLEIQTQYEGRISGAGPWGLEGLGGRRPGGGPGRGTVGAGRWAGTKPAVLALHAGHSLMKTPLCIQVTSPVRPSGQLRHDAVNYVCKEACVSCAYVFSLLKLGLKKERGVWIFCVSVTGFLPARGPRSHDRHALCV